MYLPREWAKPQMSSNMFPISQKAGGFAQSAVHTFTLQIYDIFPNTAQCPLFFLKYFFIAVRQTCLIVSAIAICILKIPARHTTARRASPQSFAVRQHISWYLGEIYRKVPRNRRKVPWIFRKLWQNPCKVPATSTNFSEISNKFYTTVLPASC